MKRLALLSLHRPATRWFPAAVASAHPLGNFTVNRFARVEVAGDRLYVRYVVDMAEIPTLQRVPIRIGAPARDGRRPAGARCSVTRTALAHPHGRRGPAHDALPGDPRGPAHHGRVVGRGR